MDIVLVRHAESIWNAAGRWQGQTDVPLSEKGRAEARALGERLRSLAFDRRITSDLSRTAQTAAAIGGDFERERAWREIDLGRWGGMLHAEVQASYPDEVAAMIEGRDVALGGAESMPGFEARVAGALDELIARSREDERVLVVTHGGVIRTLVMRLLGVRGRRAIVGAGNTSITHLRAERGRLALVAYNCDAHLERQPDPGDLVISGDASRDVVTHLDLAPEIAARLHPPHGRAATRIARGSTISMLRTFATPALAE